MTTKEKEVKHSTDEFYRLKDIKKKKATYNVIIGERSNGKTYSTLEESLIKFFKDGSKMAYIRRWQEDVIGKRASNIWKGLNDDGTVHKLSKGEYDGVLYKSGRFYLYTLDEESKQPLYNEDDLIGYVFALSASEHDKSTSYPNVKTIIFDEFMTRGTYLPDEFILLMNTISTIVRRQDDVVIYMLANTVNKYCPYFSEMGLNHVLQMTQGTIDVYRYGDSKLTVAVEYCASMKQKKVNNFYFAFGNPKLEMITGGAWELNIYPHCPIKYKPKNVEFTYFIVFNDFTYQCEIVTVGDNYFTYIHLKTTDLKYPDDDLIYSFDYSPKLNYNRNIYKPITKLQKNILWFFQTERVYYQSNDVGDAIHNYLNVCKQQK